MDDIDVLLYGDEAEEECEEMGKFIECFRILDSFNFYFSCVRAFC